MRLDRPAEDIIIILAIVCVALGALLVPPLWAKLLLAVVVTIASLIMALIGPSPAGGQGSLLLLFLPAAPITFLVSIVLMYLAQYARHLIWG